MRISSTVYALALLVCACCASEGQESSVSEGQQVSKRRGALFAAAKLAAAPPQPELEPVGETSVTCLLYTSPSPRDRTRSRMPSSA